VLQTLLFFHVLAAIGLFTGMSIELVAVLRTQRAKTVSDMRAAVLNSPLVGPIMIGSTLLLIGMGIAMIYVGGFGWTPGWIQAVFGLTIALTLIGSAITGRKAEALHELAGKAADGPVTPELDAARRDGVLNYSVFLGYFELIAALYVMITKPELAPAVGAILIAAVVAAVPAVLLSRRRVEAPATT
jgi:Predicted integral membrane protein (DUF2269)